MPGAGGRGIEMTGQRTVSRYVFRAWHSGAGLPAPETNCRRTVGTRRAGCVGARRGATLSRSVNVARRVKSRGARCAKESVARGESSRRGSGAIKNSCQQTLEHAWARRRVWTQPGLIPNNGFRSYASVTACQGVCAS